MIYTIAQQGKVLLPAWIVNVSFYSCIVSSIIIFVSIYLHLMNYRKPFEQRLMIRIQMIVPLFAFSCYSMLTNQSSFFNKVLLEPTREVYEAFVIYTFFSLLTDMLGGERNIIIMTSGRKPVSHPGIVGYILPPLDISDSYTFLGIKRGILQYVWLKPFICLSTVTFEVLGLYDVNHIGPSSLYFWLTILYNCSVTLSLYCLAIFWKILWNDLKPFNPMGKFLCVKLIIFASYWQGVILAILSGFGVLPAKPSHSDPGAPVESVAVCIQNALLCVELIAFSIGHWLSFSYKPYTISRIPNGRVIFKYAFKDIIGFRDLLFDFKLTFHGDYYKDYKQFDSVEAMIAHPDSKGRMSKINQGLRYHYDGKQKHWIASSSYPEPGQVSPSSEIQSTSELSANPNPNALSSQLQFSKQLSPSIKSSGTSTRGLYASSTKSQLSPPDSPAILSQDSELTVIPQTISEIMKSDSLLSTIDFDRELLDEDELFYQKACSVVNSYNLDHKEIKKLLNYPIVDELVDGHVFGYKVQKLRKDRLKNQPNGSQESILRRNTESNRYGSIV